MEKLDQYLQGYIRRGLPWCTCTVSIGGKRVFDRAYGFIDQEKTVPATTRTVDHLYSATKILTCVCALQLIEEGKMRLDAPVSEYMPEFASMTVRHSDGIKPAANTLTVRHLFCMTGGLDYGIEPYREYVCTHPDASTREIASVCPSVPLNFEPGSHFLYSLCHDLLGGVMEAITGKTLGQLMQERIFDPVGMTHTGFRPITDDDHPLAPLVRKTENGAVFGIEDPLSFHSEWYESGGAGLFSCAEDYIRFLEVLCNGGCRQDGKQIFSPFVLEKLRENQLDQACLADLRESWDMAGYGWSLGVRTMIEPEKANPAVSVGEFGWSGAGGVYYLVDPDKDMTLFFNMQAFGFTNNARMQVDMRNAAYEMLKEIR